MKKTFLSGIVLAALCTPCFAQQETPHVVRSTVNADSENAEFCFEFDRPLAPSSPQKLASDLHLEADGVPVKPANIVAAASSLCLFPLERGKNYHVSLAGALGIGENPGPDKKAHYKTSFTIADRSPHLAFTAHNFSAGVFARYDQKLILRAVNVAQIHLTLYHITDPAAMARAWQDRAETLLAPTESAYLARDKGQKSWQGDEDFTGAPNATVERTLLLRDKIPDLAPGLYLITADAQDKQNKKESASKGLAPLAAAWFTKSDFTVRALRDSDAIHVFAARTDVAEAKADLHLEAMTKKPESAAEAQSDALGNGLIVYPPKLADKNEIASIVATDANGNVAFADIENLPALSEQADPGSVTLASLFAAPGEIVPAQLTLTSAESKKSADASFLRLMQGDAFYADYSAPALNQDSVSLSFPAPFKQGLWNVHWMKPNGDIFAESILRVSPNPDAPHLELSSAKNALEGNDSFPVTIKSLSISGKAYALTQGHVTIGWQKLNPETLGWKDYIFGTNAGSLEPPIQAAPFITSPEGTTQINVTPPKMPPERGFYQAVLKASADSDSGILDARPLTLPLHNETTAIGIKPLAQDARFAQNGLARFALIGLSSDGKPRAVSDLSYQIYEEGRSFAWYQDSGRWQYRPEPQLRPIGSGDLAIKADGSSILEWPVTSGNYRVELLDANGKILAQTSFSAGSNATSAAVSALALTLPPLLQTRQEATAHIVLPQPAMLTVVIGDTHIRKTIHELRPKGDNVIAFTPETDWGERISLSAEAIGANLAARGVAEASLAQEPKAIAIAPAGAVLISNEDPSALIWRREENAVVTFGLENNGAAAESFHYVLSTSPGMKITSGEKGDITIGGRQSHSFSSSFSGLQTGPKNMHLEVSDAHGQHISRNWTITILPKNAFLRSEKPVAITRQQNLLPDTLKTRRGNEEISVFVARRPLEGVSELLSFLLNARPFTTPELAIVSDAMRLWQPVLAQGNVMPDFLITARRGALIAQMLNQQNADGGFPSLPGGVSTIEDTSAALTSLGPDNSDAIRPAKNLAIGWIKQRLANTWVDEKERGPRAAAYAALAAADAIDPASLHYFSDTTAASSLPALAEAQMAAAFKHIRDPDAAAFWIKKMLNENGSEHSPALLNALAATDALSSDEVLSGVVHMAETLRAHQAPPLAEAAGLLRAVSADLKNAGKGKISNGKDSKDLSGAMVLNVNDAASFAYRNEEAQSLFTTLVLPPEPLTIHAPQGAAVTRHVYRWNGVELSPSAKTVPDDIYVVELKGNLPALKEGENVVIEDGNASLRPIGCPLSPKLDNLDFIPWLTPHNFSMTAACSFTPHRISALLSTDEKESAAFDLVFFAHIDAEFVNALQPPALRIAQ